MGLDRSNNKCFAPNPSGGLGDNQAFIMIGEGLVGLGLPLGVMPVARLTVNGTVNATEVKVTATVPGPDYVFERNYNLPSLEAIKSYIDQHHHLP